jgi:hypothetical protein
MKTAKRSIVIPPFSLYTRRQEVETMKTTNKGLDAFAGGNAVPRRGIWRRCLACLVVLGAMPLMAGHSQVPQYNGGLPGPERNSSGFAGLPENANPRPDGVRALRDSMNQQENSKRLKEINLQRQKDMTSDTVKLLQLASELKSDTDKSEKEKLSMVEVRKAEMIEKLAKSVHDKMKATVGN